MSAIPAHPFAASDRAALVQVLDLLHTHIPAFDRPAGPQLTPSQTLARQIVPQALAKLQALADSPLPSIALRACQTILHFAAPGRIPLRRRPPHPQTTLRGPETTFRGPETTFRGRGRGRRAGAAGPAASSSPQAPAAAALPAAPATPLATAVDSSSSEIRDQLAEIPPSSPKGLHRPTQSPTPAVPGVRVLTTILLFILNLLRILRGALPRAIPPCPPLPRKKGPAQAHQPAAMPKQAPTLGQRLRCRTARGRQPAPGL